MPSIVPNEAASGWLLRNRRRCRLALLYHEGCNEFGRRVARIAAHMNLAGFYIECIACFVGGGGTTFMFEDERSFQNISRQCTGMGMSDLARTRGEFQDVHDGLVAGRAVLRQQGLALNS